MRPDAWHCGELTDHEKHVHTKGPDNYQYLCPGYQTDDGAGAPPAAAEPPAPAGTDAAIVTPAPSSLPRGFLLIRHHDISGLTGTGPVAEGVQFTDGTVALRWRGGHPATAVWPSVEEVLAVHGHQGATEVQWLDEPETASGSGGIDLSPVEPDHFAPLEDEQVEGVPI